MITFKTESGSVYEVNKEQNQIRRMSGVNPPTPRQGKDGEWKAFTNINEVVVGSPVLIVWVYDQNIAKSTLTSKVISVN